MTKNWTHKIKISNGFHQETEMLSDNAFGIYIAFKNTNTTNVSFKPLNDVFPDDIINTKDGILINFERELIEEDDIEYALDIMSLFNNTKKLYLQQEVQSIKIKKVLELITEEFNNLNSSYIMMKTLLKVLMLDLIRFQNKQFIPQDHHQKRVFHFLEMMETYFLKHTKGDFYATEMGISEKRLNQILKEKLNLTAKQIIQQRQITEAKRRLVKSEITIKELSFILGFDSLSSFSRFFKKITNTTPSNYRLQHKQ